MVVTASPNVGAGASTDRMRSTTTLSAMFLAAAVWSAASGASAQTHCLDVPSLPLGLPPLAAPATDADLRLAAQLAVKARAAIAAGNLLAALPDLERAFDINADLSLLGDLGLTLQAAGRLEEAWIALHRFKLEAAAQFNAQAPRLDAVLHALEAQLGAISIDANMPGAQVVLRGKVIARLPLAAPLFLLPGDVSLTLRAPGKVALRLNAQIRLGAVAQMHANFSADIGANPQLALSVPAVDADLRLAAQLAIKARAAIAAGNLLIALPDLERAFELSADLSLLGDLGLALQAAGRLEEAWLVLHRFSLEAAAQFNAQARLGAVLHSLEAQLGGLKLTGGIPGAQLMIRGQVAATLPMTTPVFLLPGDVSLSLRAPGMSPVRVNASVRIGAIAEIAAPVLTALPALPGVSVPGVGVPGVGVPGVGVPTLPPIDVPKPPLNVWPIVLGPLGGAVSIGAIVASVVFVNIKGALDVNLCGSPGASPMCPSLQATLGLTTGLQVGGYILGGVAIGLGITLAVVLRPVAAATAVTPPTINCPPHAACETRRSIARQAAPTFSCSPGVGEYTGVMCAGTF